jgi:MFS family permease
LVFFAIFNSSDVFLLLKTKEVTGSDHLTIAAYVVYNLVFAAASYPLGSLADKIGIKAVFLSGLVLFALVYILFGVSASPILIFAAFFVYGIYAAATEGISKAWITNMAHQKNTATAVGFYTSWQSIATLLASIIAGALWTAFGSSATFFITAASAILVLIYLSFAMRGRAPIAQ